MFSFFTVRPVRFFIFASKFVLYLFKQFNMFSSLRSTYHRNRCTYKNNINLIFSFLQCALLNSVIFTSNFVFLQAAKTPMTLLLYVVLFLADSDSTKKNLNFVQSTMSRLEPGYSQWRGIIQKKLNLAQLALLKLDLQVTSFRRSSTWPSWPSSSST